MIEKLFLVALGSAGIVHVLHHGLIFAFIKERVKRKAPQGQLPSTFVEWLAAGFMCHYCLAHWMAAMLAAVAATSIREWLLLAFAGAWVANHSLGLFNVLSAELGPMVQAKGRYYWIQAKQTEQAMQEYPPRPENPSHQDRVS